MERDVLIRLRLNNGECIRVDPDFADWIDRNWRKGWALRRTNGGHRRPELIIPGPRGGERRYRVARLICNAPPGLFPQHLNGDVMDCRRSNLRLIRSRGEAGYPPNKLQLNALLTKSKA
jgi:hypothetical protein